MTQQADTRQDVESPCVMACVVDQSHGYCLGCWRTLREISDWRRYSPQQKQALLAQLESRCAAHSNTH